MNHIEQARRVLNIESEEISLLASRLDSSFEKAITLLTKVKASLMQLDKGIK